MNAFNQADEIRKALNPYIKRIVEEQTKECLRTYKAKVIVKPNQTTGKCGIQLIGQDQVLQLPYSTAVASVGVGDMVWVATTYNSWRNAVVWQKIDFS